MLNTDPWTITEKEYPHDRSWVDRLTFLVRYAMLAPSSHNTQPWSFRIRDNAVDVFMDEARWLKIADDDQRELHISIGCALENLLVATEHFKLANQVEYLPDPIQPMLAATIRFRTSGLEFRQRPPCLFSMIVVRHTNHGEYESRPIPDDILTKLQSVCTENGVTLYLSADFEVKRKADELVVRADALEFADPAFREELGYWIGQGAFGTSWLMSKIGKLAVTYLNMGSSISKKDTALLMSSPVLGLISTTRNDRTSQIKVGQVYQRLSLFAASFGIWCQPMSQILQVETTQAETVQLQPDPTLFPQHPFRMGFATPEKHHTPRRTLGDTIR